ncbi:MAG: M23 family metallopeptidase [Gemmatimonadota bacterium]
MRSVKTTITGLVALLVALPCAAPAQGTNSMPDSVAAAAADGLQPIERRANDIAGLFRGDPGGYDEVFAGSFLSQIPAATLDQIFTGMHAEHGSAIGAEVVGPFTGGASIVRVNFEDGTAVLLQLALEPAPPHRVTGAQLGPVFEVESVGVARGASRISAPTYPTDDYETRTRLRLPFEGEWWVFWGGRSRDQNYHRASALQRYAYDFVVRREGSTHRGDGDRNEDYWCEGEPVLAPAAGIVVVVEDGVPENVPGETNADQKLGNHVVIDHGNGEFSLFAHLQTASARVERGGAVEAGTPVGACGNSGNSTEPHLHYQLQTGPDFFASESVPAPFHDYLSDGERVEVGEPRRGETVAPAPR